MRQIDRVTELVREHAGDALAVDVRRRNAVVRVRRFGGNDPAIHHGGCLDDGLGITVAVAVFGDLGERDAQYLVLRRAEDLFDHRAVLVVDDVQAAFVVLAVDLGGGRAVDHVHADARHLAELGEFRRIGDGFPGGRGHVAPLLEGERGDLVGLDVVQEHRAVVLVRIVADVGVHLDRTLAHVPAQRLRIARIVGRQQGTGSLRDRESRGQCHGQS